MKKPCASTVNDCSGREGARISASAVAKVNEYTTSHSENKALLLFLTSH